MLFDCKSRCKWVSFDWFCFQKLRSMNALHVSVHLRTYCHSAVHRPRRPAWMTSLPTVYQLRSLNRAACIGFIKHSPKCQIKRGAPWVIFNGNFMWETSSHMKFLGELSIGLLHLRFQRILSMQSKLLRLESSQPRSEDMPLPLKLLGALRAPHAVWPSLNHHFLVRREGNLQCAEYFRDDSDTESAIRSWALHPPPANFRFQYLHFEHFPASVNAISLLWRYLAAHSSFQAGYACIDIEYAVLTKQHCPL